MKGKILTDLEVIEMADEGKAIAKHEGMVVFIDKAVPGDIVDVYIKKKKKSYIEAEVTVVKKPSSLRREPFCEHFGTCGGCKWQYLDYASQLTFKEKQVKDALERIGKFENVNLIPILGSSITKYYRNKLDYSFADRKWLSYDEFSATNEVSGPGLGFHIAGKFDKVLDIENCYLQPDPSNAIRLAVRAYCLTNEMSFMNIRHKEGMMRGLIIRNTLSGGLMVIVMVYQNNREKLEGLLKHLEQSFPQITSLLYVINPKGNDTFHDLVVHTWSGLPYITEEMEGLQFRIGPKSFFQTNPTQTLALYRLAREFAAIKNTDIVYDLYTGTGTIALFVASLAKKVVGIEYVEESIDNAKLNAELNNIKNSVFFSGDMKDLLSDELFDQEGKPDVIITDPPRSGMHEDVVAQLLKSNCPRIVYVSCNPGTQARDLLMLSEKYNLMKVQAVDMFPHTAHVESVALLELK